MTLHSHNGDIEGSYRYANQEKHLTLKGFIANNRTFTINEYNDNGSMTGVFEGDGFLDDSEITGTWSKPDGSKSMQFSLKPVSVQ